MIIRHPKTEEEIQSRNALLQTSLRPADMNFPVTDEYPLVLSSDNCSYSYCQFNGDRVIAHFNLYPKEVIDAKGKTCLNIGLVGNVATDERCRGQGLMKGMFHFLQETAQTEGLDALILWSDLVQFYQKLGFQSLATERFLTITTKSLQKSQTMPLRQEVICTPEGDLSDSDIEQLLSLRPSSGLYLKRSIKEFRALLQIPECYLLIAGPSQCPLAYLVIGKGYDMIGVVHEWGFREWNAMVSAFTYILTTTSVDQFYLLSPAWKMDKKVEKVATIASSIQEQPMCFYRPIAKNQQLSCLENLFVWGLDSI